MRRFGVILLVVAIGAGIHGLPYPISDSSSESIGVPVGHLTLPGAVDSVPCGTECKLSLILQELKELRQEVEHVKRAGKAIANVPEVTDPPEDHTVLSSEQDLATLPEVTDLPQDHTDPSSIENLPSVPELSDPPEDPTVLPSIQNLIDAITYNEPSLAKSHLASLPLEYQHVPELILTEAEDILNSNPIAMFKVFKFLIANNQTDSPIDLAISLLGLQQESGAVQNPDTFKLQIQAISNVLNTTNSSIESELDFLRIVLKNLIRALPNEDLEAWIGTESWLGNNFYKLFKNLSKKDAFVEVIEAFEGSGNNLTLGQLNYIERRYYDCADSQGVVDETYGIENYFNFSTCNGPLKSSALIPAAIYNEISSTTGSTNRTADDLVESHVAMVLRLFPIIGTDGNLKRLYSNTVNDDNLWLKLILDAVFLGVENGAGTCDVPCTTHLLRILHPLHDNLLLYPFITEQVISNVTRMFYDNPINIYPVIKNITRLPASLEKLATETIASLLEDKPFLAGDQEILLAHNLAKFNLQNESLWAQIPPQPKIIAAAANNKTAIQLLVIADGESYEVFGKNDSTLGLRPFNPLNPADQIWVLQAKFAVGRLHLRFFLIDTQTSEFGRLHYERNGLRHELRAPRKGNYAFAVSMNSEETFNMRSVSSKRFFCIIRDEIGQPAQLTECEWGSEYADFSVKVLEGDWSSALKLLV